MAYALLLHSDKCRDYKIYVDVKSSNVPPEKYRFRLKESFAPPLNNDSESNVPNMFIHDLRTFVGGHFWPNFSGRGGGKKPF